jgi:hypothetical protein
MKRLLLLGLVACSAPDRAHPAAPALRTQAEVAEWCRAKQGTALTMSPATQTPPDSVVAAVRDECKDTHPQLAGPWTRGGHTWWAGLAWRDGASDADASEPPLDACLVLLEGTEMPQLVAHEHIAPGWSDRYHQAFAPSLMAQPFWGPGDRPGPIVTAEAMGAGGGGGTAIQLFIPVGGRLLLALSAMPAQRTRLDSESEGRCTPGELFMSTSTGPGAMRLDGCFDDAPVTSCYQWVANHYELVSHDGT